MLKLLGLKRTTVPAPESSQTAKAPTSGAHKTLLGSLRSRGSKQKSSPADAAHDRSGGASSLPAAPPAPVPRATRNFQHGKQCRAVATVALEQFINSPGFRVSRDETQPRPQLAHPDSTAASWKRPPNVARWGDYFVKVDEQLNGSRDAFFDAFAVLRENFVQAVMATTGDGPDGSLALLPQQPARPSRSKGADAPVPPMVVTISRAVAGREIDIGDAEAVRAELKTPGWSRALTFAYLLGMSDVWKPTGLLQNVVQSRANQRIMIIDGYDASPPQLQPAILGSPSINALLGMSREQADNLLAQARQQTLEFAEAHRDLMGWQEPFQKILARPGVPYLQAFDSFVDECRRRLFALEE